MHMWNLKCSSKANMSGVVVGDDDDNHKQTTTSRHSLVLINQEHLLNRSRCWSPLFTRLLNSTAKSGNANCLMNYERWKQRANAKEWEENVEIPLPDVFNRIVSLLWFSSIFSSFSAKLSETQRFSHHQIDELICRCIHMRRHLRRWRKIQFILIEN